MREDTTDRLAVPSADRKKPGAAFAGGRIASAGGVMLLPAAERRSGIGAFMAVLRTKEELPARAMEFTILTAARSGEALGARWSEIDRSEAIWTVPGDRMKAGREHRVKLSEAALVVLRKLLPTRDTMAGDWVFPGAREGRPLSNMAMEMLLRRMGRVDLRALGAATWGGRGATDRGSSRQRTD
jgi:integrase